MRLIEKINEPKHSLSDLTHGTWELFLVCAIEAGGAG